MLAVIIFIISISMIMMFNIYRYFIKYPIDPSVKYANNYQYYKMMKELERHKNDKFLFSNFYLMDGDLLANYLKLLKIKGENIEISLGEISIFYNNVGKDVAILAEGIYSNLYIYLQQYFKNLTIYRSYNEYYFYFLNSNKIINLYGWKRPELVTNWLREWYFGKKYNRIIPLLDFVLIYIRYEDIKELFSLNVKYIDEDNKIANDKIKTIKINSLLEIPDYGIYNIKTTDEKAKVWINDILIQKPVRLYKGLHRLRIEIKNPDMKQIQIFWQKENGNLEAIPINYFINSNKIYGLMAYYTSNDKIVYQALEPTLQFNSYFYYPRPGIIKCPGNKCKIKWKGYLEVVEEGDYEIYLDTDMESQVIINQKIVSEKQEYAKPELRRIFLKKGKHKIEINSVAAQIEDSTRLMWKRNDAKTFIPVSSVYLTPF